MPDGRGGIAGGSLWPGDGCPQRYPCPNPGNLWLLPYMTKKGFAGVVKDLEMGRLSWMIWEDPKCGHTEPHKRETEGHCGTHRGGASGDGLEIGDSAKALSQPPEAGRGRDLIPCGVSNLRASLGHTGRRAVLGHTLNIQTLTKTDKQKKRFEVNLRFCVGLHS